MQCPHCTVAMDVSVESASRETERQVEHRLPLQLQEEAGAEVHERADRHMYTHPGSHGTSGQGQGLSEASPEPGLGAGVGVVADSDEPQDAGELFLHCLVLDGDQSLLMGTRGEAERKLSLEITFLAL